MLPPWVELFSVWVAGEPKGQPRGRAFALKRCPAGHQFQPNKPRCPHCGQKGKVVSRVHDPGTAEHWKGAISAAVESLVPPAPIAAPVRLVVDCYFKRPQRLMRRADPEGPVRHDLKPDWDNLGKPVSDALQTLGFVDDDKRVCDGTVRTFYHAKAGAPGARIRFYVEAPPPVEGALF